MIRCTLLIIAISVFFAGVAGAHDLVGVIVPAYFDPGKLWDQMIADKKAHPGVPFCIIANPNSGPGEAPEADYIRTIREAQDAGITVLGYVHTSYGTRGTKAVDLEIARWESWYKINGIFLDEMSSDPGHEAYYAALTHLLHKSHRLTIGNPGTTTSRSYYGTVDILMIHESPGFADGAASELPAKDLASISSSQPTINLPRLLAQKVSLVYSTDETDPPTYARLPKYFDQLVAELDK
jgi:hypothetical protein